MVSAETDSLGRLRTAFSAAIMSPHLEQQSTTIHTWWLSRISRVALLQKSLRISSSCFRRESSWSCRDKFRASGETLGRLLGVSSRRRRFRGLLVLLLLLFRLVALGASREALSLAGGPLVWLAWLAIGTLLLTVSSLDCRRLFFWFFLLGLLLSVILLAATTARAGAGGGGGF